MENTFVWIPSRLWDLRFCPLILCTFLYLFSLCLNGVHSIGCFVCTSVNRSNPSCEDKFNSTVDHRQYVSDCWSGRKDRKGLFPGTQCIKLKADVEGTNYTIVARNCVADNGDYTSDTEIGRETHCGWVRLLEFNGKDMRGCILTCGSDGCNSAKRIQISVISHLAWILPILIYYQFLP